MDQQYCKMLLLDEQLTVVQLLLAVNHNHLALPVEQPTEFQRVLAASRNVLFSASSTESPQLSGGGLRKSLTYWNLHEVILVPMKLAQIDKRYLRRKPRCSIE